MKTTPTKPTSTATNGPSIAPKGTSGTKSSETTSKPSDKPKNKGGAPRGSANHLRHGLRCGVLPKDALYIEHRLNALRRNLENAVLALRGEVTIADAAYIQSVVRWERHACLAGRWLTKMQDELKPEQRLNFSREIAKASSERDKAITALRLGKGENEQAPWLDALPSPESTEPTNGDTERD